MKKSVVLIAVVGSLALCGIGVALGAVVATNIPLIVRVEQVPPISTPVVVVAIATEVPPAKAPPTNTPLQVVSADSTYVTYDGLKATLPGTNWQEFGPTSEGNQSYMMWQDNNGYTFTLGWSFAGYHLTGEELLGIGRNVISNHTDCGGGKIGERAVCNSTLGTWNGHEVARVDIKPVSKNDLHMLLYFYADGSMIYMTSISMAEHTWERDGAVISNILNTVR